MASTDDIPLFVETIIIDMNLGYENSNIPVRVKTHCIEHALMDDLSESSDTLHAFNVYKPSYAEIRFVIPHFHIWFSLNSPCPTLEDPRTLPNFWPITSTTAGAATPTRPAPVTATLCPP